MKDGLYQVTTKYFCAGFEIKNTKVEYHHYEKCDDNNLNETVIKLGQNLIKK